MENLTENTTEKITEGVEENMAEKPAEGVEEASASHEKEARVEKRKNRGLALFMVAVLILGMLLGSGGTFLGLKIVKNAALVDRDYLDKVSYIAEKYAKLERMYNIIDTMYYGEYDQESLMEGIYDGLFSSLDKYSVYLNKEEYKSMMDRSSASFAGVGVVMSVNENDEIVIIAVYEDSPASKAGLQVGDIITGVDGISYKGSDLDVASAQIKGEKGTKVTVQIKRNGGEVPVIMVRDTIQNSTVGSGYLENENGEVIGHDKNKKLGYIVITSFGTRTAQEFKEQLRDLELDGVDGVVIDIRNNGGGVVDAAISIADQLLKEGVIMVTKNRTDEDKVYNSDASATDVPYVLLVNEYSASASEILAAAIKGNKGGSIVGTTTYGKGVVQSVGGIDNSGDAFKLTTEEYFGPGDMKINGVGVVPDYEVKLDENSETDVQLEKAFEVLCAFTD